MAEQVTSAAAHHPSNAAPAAATDVFDASGTDWLPFHLPSIDDGEIDAVVQTLRSGWLTTGPRVSAFEHDFAAFVGAEHALAINSATAGLHLALEAVGVRDGDEVIVPTLTFAATGEVVAYLRAIPVLVDSEPDTFNIDPEEIERAITPRTKAILPVHFGGQPCDMAAITDIARRHHLSVIEDAAHALPAAFDSKPVGTIGDITCFSFYPTKTITTGEGGMNTTARADYDERMRMMSLHGLSRDAWKRYSAAGSWRYEILHPGFKYNLTDIAAALGIAQLRRCRELCAARTRIARQYDEAFADVSEIDIPVTRSGRDHAWHLYVIRLALDRLRIDRDHFLTELKERRIGASVHFIPLHLHPYYRDALGWDASRFPHANAAFERIISLPIYPRMSVRDVDRVATAVRDIVARYRR